MRIKILNFKITETFTMVEDMNVFVYAWRSIFGPELKVEYHFDVEIQVDPDYLTYCRPLEKNEYLQLPNQIRLLVWSVERDKIKAKTTTMVKEDLRGYHPIEMWLVYPRVHGHLTDRA